MYTVLTGFGSTFCGLSWFSEYLCAPVVRIVVGTIRSCGGLKRVVESSIPRFESKISPFSSVLYKMAGKCGCCCTWCCCCWDTKYDWFSSDSGSSVTGLASSAKLLCVNPFRWFCLAANNGRRIRTKPAFGPPATKRSLRYCNGWRTGIGIEATGNENFCCAGPFCEYVPDKHITRII